jgi:hypothetical protein
MLVYIMTVNLRGMVNRGATGGNLAFQALAFAEQKRVRLKKTRRQGNKNEPEELTDTTT